VLVGSVLAITVVGGTLLAVLFDQEFPGRNVARLLAIAPFFVMPTVSALVWKNLMLHPIYGVAGSIARGLGLEPVDWFADFPMFRHRHRHRGVAVAALRAADPAHRRAVARPRAEGAARMDGAGPVSQFFFITLPHLGRAISVVVMIETIFLLSVFAEIYVTTSGGPGLASTNLAFLIYLRALREYDVGGASAAGVIAVILANIVAIFLVRSIAKNIAD
jgi:sorbitol/mannitol transport system permease protein